MARSAEGQAPKKWRGRWRASILIGYNAKGNPKRKYCYGKTKEECLDKWNKLKRQQSDGMLPTGPKLTTKQWFEHWLTVKEKEVSARTIEEYSYTLKHVLPYLGGIKLDKLTPLKVQRMQLAVAEKVSARAAIHSRGLVHNALDDALKLGLVTRNVAAAVKPVKYERPEFQIWTADEIIRFLEHAKVSPYYSLYYTALTTGMRPGELMALHWENVEGDKIHVRHTVSVVNNQARLGPPKTKRSNRVIDLPWDTVSVLEQHRENLVLIGYEGDLVFPTRTGTFVRHNNLLRNLRTHCKRAEVTQIRVHDLRHTFASMRIASGTDIVRLSRDLGHANASFTLDVYAHLFDRYNRRDVPSLQELIGLDRAA